MPYFTSIASSSTWTTPASIFRASASPMSAIATGSLPMMLSGDWPSSWRISTNNTVVVIVVLLPVRLLRPRVRERRVEDLADLVLERVAHQERHAHALVEPIGEDEGQGPRDVTVPKLA